jgi:hypothetical protein
MNSYRTAVHEEGHTVVGRALGMTCGDASIIRDPEEGEEGHSICADPYTVQWDWEQRGKFRLPRSVFVGRILTFMAGAERRQHDLVVAYIPPSAFSAPDIFERVGGHRRILHRVGDRGMP